MSLEVSALQLGASAHLIAPLVEQLNQRSACEHAFLQIKACDLLEVAEVLLLLIQRS